MDQNTLLFMPSFVV